MPITTSAKKALRASKRKHIFNIRRQKAVKDTTKAVAKADPKSADVATLLSKAYQALDKAAKVGTIKKGTAARKKSRLAKALKRKAS